jgi:ribonuclease D
MISDQRTLDAELRRWRAAGRIAFDTEFIRDETFHAALCLVQVACEGEVVLVDPAGDLRVDGFWELVCDPAVLKIVHAGKEDFDVCLRACGAAPRNIFDVQIAAGFVGLGYPLSLARLVMAVLHKRISKAQTLTDWLRRPLTKDQVEYAVDDVAHLPAIHSRLADKIEQLERSDWAREEFARFEDPAFYKPPMQDRLLRMKGTRGFDALSLAVLARLLEWRENWAREKNRPMRAMMRDDVLVEIARRRPSRPEQIEVLRGFPQSRNPRIIREILDLIQAVRKSPPEQWPSPEEIREETPMMRVTLDILSAFLRATCFNEQVDIDLVGSAQRLRDLLDFLQNPQSSRPALLSGWRRDFIGKRLVDLLEGRCELHLSGFPDSLRLEVMAHPAERRRSAKESG